MSRPCGEIEDWLGRPREVLSEGQRLALEHHLASCADCRALHALSRAMGDLVRSAPAELTSGARERAIAAAFERAVAPRTQVRSRGAVWSGIAVAAAVLLMFAGRALWPHRAAPVATQTSPAAAPVWIEVAQRETRTFAHARVTMNAGSRVRFDAERSALELDRGALEIDVDPTPHAPFAVITRQLRVEVLGTQFQVGAGEVRVQHGHVRVLERASGRPVADLHAGEHYRIGAAPEPEGTAVEPGSATPGPVASNDEPAAPAKRARQPVVSAKALLERARAALAADDLASTRSSLTEAERAARTRADRAEAGTLRAELALRERDWDGASRAYLDVARRYPELAAGENALFAAAQLRARQGDPSALLAQYLQRYPQGRFAAEAHKRLQAQKP